MNMLRSVLLAACVGISAWWQCDAHAQQAPAGWSRIKDPAPGMISFAPNQLGANERTEVVFYPRAPLSNQAIEQWLNATVSRDAPPAGGSWTGAAQVSSQTVNIAMATREYRDASGSAGVATYTALSVDKLYVRLLRWHVSSADVGNHYKAGAIELSKQLVLLEKTAASTEQRGVAIEKEPPAVQGIKPGGPLVPGHYIGNRLSGKTLMYAIDLYLFPNGEYLMPAEKKWNDRKGHYKYQPGSGKLNIEDILYNSSYDEGDFCIFGRDASGSPVIYAENDYGTSTHKVLLRRVGDVDRLAPTEAKAAEEAAEAEAKRYKYVTAPGQGIRPQEIETVAYSWQLVYQGAGSRMDYEAYLLLKDGTVHDGVPVPPQDMDLGLSRRREPEKWGRWRREGNGYAFAWPGRPQEWKKLQGGAMLPGQRGMTLQGEWSASSSSAVPMGTSTWSRWGVKLQPDGRFEKSHAGGMYAAGAPGTEVVTSTRYDNEGAVTSTSAPGVAIGVQRKNPEQGNRSGRYEIDGYAITLRYDNGRVERQPFFIDSDRKSIWFDGSMLTR